LFDVNIFHFGLLKKLRTVVLFYANVFSNTKFDIDYTIYVNKF